MVFSIIIVSYNSSKFIDDTLKSIRDQSFTDYEIVVVDGNSTDDSVEKFELQSQFFENIKIISEPDRGIYDAMNKGISYTSGDYIFFLNLGDKFFDCSVLEKMSVLIEKTKCDLYYGDVMWGANRTNYPSKLSHLYFLREKMPCHQAIFAKKSLLVKFPFNIKFKVCADRDWLIRAFKSGMTYEKADVITCYYDLNGKSSDYSNYGRDSLRVTRNSYGLIGTLFVRLKRLLGKAFH